MSLGLKLFIWFTVTIACAYGQSGQRIAFVTEALKRYNYCDDLTRNDCLFYHEATDKCSQTCANRIKNGNPQRTNTNNGRGRTGGRTGGRAGGRGGRVGGGCFSGESNVETNMGTMKMRDLFSHKDVRVLSMNDNNQLAYSPISSWIHANESTETPFIILTTESGQVLSITDVHLIYETDCRGNKRTIFARRVQIGRCLFVNDQGTLKESKVVDKKVERNFGIYAPVTENGNIVVDDVLASCFTNFENEFLVKSLYSISMLLKRFANTFLPPSLAEVFADTSYNTIMDVPQMVLSFVDLSKLFTK